MPWVVAKTAPCMQKTYSSHKGVPQPIPKVITISRTGFSQGFLSAPFHKVSLLQKRIWSYSLREMARNIWIISAKPG